MLKSGRETRPIFCAKQTGRQARRQIRRKWAHSVSGCVRGRWASGCAKFAWRHRHFAWENGREWAKMGGKWHLARVVLLCKTACFAMQNVPFRSPKRHVLEIEFVQMGLRCACGGLAMAIWQRSAALKCVRRNVRKCKAQGKLRHIGRLPADVAKRGCGICLRLSARPPWPFRGLGGRQCRRARSPVRRTARARGSPARSSLSSLAGRWWRRRRW